MTHTYTEKAKDRFCRNRHGQYRAFFQIFFRMMEEVEHNFFSSLDLGSFIINREKASGLPRVHASCDYWKPVMFNETIDIQLIVEQIGKSSISYRFNFNSENGDRVATGKITSVFVAEDKGSGTVKSIPVPDEVRSIICEAPSTDT